jgi:hypothetical protein
MSGETPKEPGDPEPAQAQLEDERSPRSVELARRGRIGGEVTNALMTEEQKRDRAMKGVEGKRRTRAIRLAALQGQPPLHDTDEARADWRPGKRVGYLATREREVRFAIAWIQTLGDAMEAARRSGCRSKSESALRSLASRYLERPTVQQELRNLRRRSEMDALEALSLVGDVANASLAPFLDDDGRINIKAARRAGKLHWLKKYRRSTRTDGTVDEEVELYSAQEARALILKVHGYLDSRRGPLKTERELDELLIKELGRVRPQIIDVTPEPERLEAGTPETGRESADSTDRANENGEPSS